MRADSEERLNRFFRGLTHRPVAVLMLVLALAGTSVIAALRIPIEMLPQGFAMSAISVNAAWPGANPAEIEERVVRPLEEELRTVRGVLHVDSTAAEGVGFVNLSFSGSHDMDQAYAEVADRLERARPRLPREVDRVVARRFTSADQPILWCGILYSEELEDEVQGIVEDGLVPRLEAVEGVARVRVEGLRPRSVRILLDEDRVRANRVDVGELLRRLQGDNLSEPVGDLDDAGQRWIVRVDGRFANFQQIEDFPVRRGLRIRDIGRVVAVNSAPQYLFRVDGRYAMGMAISKETAANTFATCKRVKELLERGLRSDPLLGQLDYQVFWSEGDTVESSLRDLIDNASIGGLIACAVLFLFLRRVRYTLLVALSIPFSVLATLAWLYFSGDSFNLFSMMGITISVGMLVDNSVVIVESIFQRRERGDSLEEACVRGPAEMMLAVVTATLTTIVVFLPLIFMTEDRNARVFTTSIGIPLCVALAAALVLAILIVPVAARGLARRERLRPPRPPRRPSPLLSLLLHPLRTGIPATVAWALRHRFQASLLALLFLASGQYARSGNSLVGDLGGGGQMRIGIRFAANTTLEDADRAIRPLEEALLSPPLHDRLLGATIGIGYGRRDGDLNLWFDRPIHPDQEKELRKLLDRVLPRNPVYELELGDEFQEGDRQDRKWLRAVISGPDSAKVEELAAELRTRAQADPRWEEVAKPEDTTREVVVTLDRQRMERVGATSRMVLGIIEWGLRGLMVSRYQTPRGDIPIIMEFDQPEDPDRGRLEELGVARTANGTELSLASLASFQNRRGPGLIQRRDGRTTATVGLKPVDPDLKAASRALHELTRGIEVPEGYRWDERGGLADFQADLGELRSAFVLAVALVFLLMGLLFESLLLPFSVLITIAFAVVGANWSFKLSGTPIDIVGMIGMIVLAGVVVNNGIVLVDRIIRLERRGVERDRAVIQGVRDRLRPVLMTALTTIAGLLPIALAEPDGSGISFQGLAVGVSGGLAFTTFFTLWVVPLLYTLFQDLGHQLDWIPARLLGRRGLAGESGIGENPRLHLPGVPPRS